MNIVIHKTILQLSSLVCLLLLGHIAMAQTQVVDRVTAEQVAASVQAFYDQSRSVAADFNQTYYHKLYDRYERSTGKVLFVKPGKMRWDYAKPNGKVIVSDGKTLQIYEPGDKNGGGQVFEHAISNAELPQAMSFLTGTSRLSDDFRFRLLKAKAWRFQGQVLELRPKKANPQYERILFFVDSNPARLGVVHRVLVVDHTGNRNKFEFRNLRFNRPVAKNAFRWKAPAGTRHINP